MLLTSSVLSTTSKRCFELTSSVLSATSKRCFELTSSVLSATSKRCFELTSSVLSTTSKRCFELTSSVLSATSKRCFELTSSVLSATSKRCKVAHQLPFSYASSIKRVCSLLIQRFITISSHPPSRKISFASKLSSPSCAQKILASALRKSRATSGRNSLRR
ncbi:3-ketoacyl-ACP reductase [Streptococcus pneumoniae]|nr:3-ketoacyl-ACP reductase [Streptococcus pneumoniae]